jgi:hypothetical protein
VARQQRGDEDGEGHPHNWAGQVDHPAAAEHGSAGQRLKSWRQRGERVIQARSTLAASQLAAHALQQQACGQSGGCWGCRGQRWGPAAPGEDGGGAYEQVVVQQVGLMLLHLQSRKRGAADIPKSPPQAGGQRRAPCPRPPRHTHAPRCHQALSRLARRRPQQRGSSSPAHLCSEGLHAVGEQAGYHIPQQPAGEPVVDGGAAAVHGGGKRGGGCGREGGPARAVGGGGHILVDGSDEQHAPRVWGHCFVRYTPRHIRACPCAGSIPAGGRAAPLQ